jgi:sialate O-acetylesterase
MFQMTIPYRRRLIVSATSLTLAHFSVVLLVLHLVAQNLRADVKLPGLFSDNLVLQQEMRVPIWGWADDGEKVTVEFRGKKASTIAKDGKWAIRIDNFKAGGPDTLTISGKNTLVLKNVLVGEVWVCSGQSNMEWPLEKSFEPEGDIAASTIPMLRLFTVPKLKADQPTNDVDASWQECNPQTTTKFSAVAYYFGRELQKARGVPVGLIHTSWGGSPAEVWMSHDVLEDNPDYKKAILDSFGQATKKYQTDLAKFEAAQAELKKQGKTSDKKPPAKPYWKPSELYNGMIAPLLPYAIRGAIWYQGESNAGRAYQYRNLFPDMIRNWRRAWGQGDFTFLAVQLAPWDKGKKRSVEAITAAPGESDWAELREAQLLATKALPKVGLAVITDVGDKDDIHPTKKAPVGARLALAARGIAYREKVVYSGPLYRSMTVKKDKAIISFDHTGRGLEAGADVRQAFFSPDGKMITVTGSDKTTRVWDVKTGQTLDSNGKVTTSAPRISDVRTGKLVQPSALTGFSIAGPDGKFFWADAEIKGGKVVVSSAHVPRPVAVRYGWADYPVVNLWNKDGLPASPFRTDTFAMITKPK